MPPDALMSAKNSPKWVWRPGPPGGAHSAPPGSLAGFKGFCF